MDRIIISGWYGFGNLGDEAILQSISATIHKHAPGAVIEVLSFNPSFTTTYNKTTALPQFATGFKSGVKSIIDGRFFRTLAGLIRCDVLLLGGGGFLSDWQPEAPWVWLRQALLARLLGKKVMLYGIGAGPFTRPAGKWITRTITNRCVSAVTVRDHESLRWLLEAGVRPDLLRITADPAVNYPITAPVKQANKRRKIGISATSLFHSEQLWPGKKSKYTKYLDAMVVLVTRLLQEDFEVVFIPMHPASDIPFAQAILEHVTAAGTTILPLPANIDEAVSTLGQVDILVTMRFHSAILGALQGIPVAGIIYHHKVAEFLKEIGVADYAEELGDGSNWREADVDPERLVSKIQRIAANYEQIKLSMVENLHRLQENEQGNIAVLKTMLGHAQ